jgi:hypothetical protein
MKTKIMLMPLAVLFFSCQSTFFYQVYKTESQTVKSNNANVISYEDSQCRIDYNLWAEKGNAGFTFYNKTDEVIHLQLDESFYVLNGIAYDYYQNRIFSDGSNTITKVTNGGGLYSGLGWMTMYAKSITSGDQHSVATVEARQISVPPKTARSISEFDINRTIYRDCELFLYPSRKQIKGKTFTAATSPLKFYNTIAYTVGNKEVRTKINNDFYVSEITNYPDDQILVNDKNAFCGQDGTTTKVVKEAAPSGFYLKYVKGSNDFWKH